MKIIEHGQTFIFKCDACGCKFEVGTNEKCLDHDDSRFVTGPKKIYCHCPECDNRVSTEIIETVMDGGFTRVESQEKQTP